MGALGTLVLAGALSLWVLWRPWRDGFWLLVGVTVLVPATIGVPSPFGDALTIHRAVVLALVLGLLVHRERVADHRPLVQPPPVVGALAVYVAGALVAGVLLADLPTDFSQAVLDWLKTLDQLVVLAVAVALVRLRGAEHAAQVVATVAGITVVLAGVEAVAGRSVSGLLFDTSIGGEAAADALESRAGGDRVRVGAEFALQLGWMLLTMLPLAVMGVLHRYRRRLVALGGVGPAALAVTVVISAVAVAVLATRTRSALVVLPLVVLLLALLVRRTAVRLALPLVATAGAVALLQPEVQGMLSTSVDPGAIAVRFERLPSVLAATGDDALLGLGFAGLDARGIPTTDISYLLTYAETGAVGLVLLLLAAGLALAWCLRGVSGVRGMGGDAADHRHAVAGAGAVAAATMLLGGAAFDAFSLGNSARLFWIVVAVGGVAGETLVGRHRVPGLRPGLVTTAAAAGLVVGVVALTLAPRAATARYLFTTVPTETEAVVEIGGGYTGLVYVMTVCDALAAGAPEPLERGECHNLPEVPGGGEIRLVAEAPAQVTEGADALEAHARDSLGIEAFELHALERPSTQAPSALRAAPAWVPLLLVGLALVVPSRRPEEDPTPAQMPPPLVRR